MYISFVHTHIQTPTACEHVPCPRPCLNHVTNPCPCLQPVLCPRPCLQQVPCPRLCLKHVPCPRPCLQHVPLLMLLSKLHACKMQPLLLILQTLVHYFTASSKAASTWSAASRLKSHVQSWQALWYVASAQQVHFDPLRARSTSIVTSLWTLARRKFKQKLKYRFWYRVYVPTICKNIVGP